MCLICVDLVKGRLTLNEARRNLREMRITESIHDDHYGEVIDLIAEKQGKEDYEILRQLFSKG